MEKYLGFAGFLKYLKYYNHEINTDFVIGSFKKYYEILVQENEKYNLTAITDENEVYLKHFIDSLYILNFVDLTDKNVMDIGSGAGFPGLPLAIVCPDTRFVLVEPTTKRCNFLKLIINEIGLKNVEVLNKRAEDLSVEYREKFDIVTSRAVSNLSIILELSVAFAKVNGHVIPFKGSSYEEEIIEAKNALNKLNLKVEKAESYKINEDINRSLIFIRKFKTTPNKYPRNYSDIKSKTL